MPTPHIAPCITSLLAGGEAAAEREHHDAGEADADDEHPGLPVAEDLRGLGGAVDAHDGVVADEGAGDRGHEAGELTDDLADDGGFVAGRGAGGAARDREQSERRTWAAQSLPGSSAAQLTS